MDQEMNESAPSAGGGKRSDAETIVSKTSRSNESNRLRCKISLNYRMFGANPYFVNGSE